MINAFLRRAVPERFRPIGYLTHLVRERTHDTVRLGPFAGMRYVQNSIGSAHLPKLLGTYERELAEVIEAVCAGHPKLIVNIGAAEGYYAVGLARRNPQARIVAFEREENGRAALGTMARLNGVEERVVILGECGPRELERTLQVATSASPAAQNTPFVLCDVEGDEEHLLNPATVPCLRQAIVLVETHEFVAPGVTDRLLQRFALTHKVECLWQSERSREEFPFHSVGTALLPRSYITWAVSEWRPMQMCWLWMQPRE